MLSYPSDEVGNHLVSLDALDEKGINPYSDVLSLEKYRELFGYEKHPFTGIDYVEYYENLIKESGADSLKIEGGEEYINVIRQIVNAGIPVMGHLGLMPQSINKYGSYAIRAKEDKEAEKLMSDAKLLEEAGCYAIVLEKIPATLAKRVAESVNIPIIGIGAGHEVDGQVLVMQDMLGITQNFSPKFVRKYANIGETITNAVQAYISDVKDCSFPNEDEEY